MSKSSDKPANLGDVFSLVFMVGLYSLIAYFVHPEDAKRYEGWFIHGSLCWGLAWHSLVAECPFRSCEQGR